MQSFCRWLRIKTHPGKNRNSWKRAGLFVTIPLRLRLYIYVYSYICIYIYTCVYIIYYYICYIILYYIILYYTILYVCIYIYIFALNPLICPIFGVHNFDPSSYRYFKSLMIIIMCSSMIIIHNNTYYSMVVLQSCYYQYVTIQSYPDAPCPEYLPTFIPRIAQM